MPSDLIYREDAKDYARHAIAKGLNVLEYLDEVPAADFRPVVRAHWIPTGETVEVYGDVYRCSACGCCDVDEVDYCPNCGAMMEES